MGDGLVAVVGSFNMDLAVRTPRAPLQGENLSAYSLRIGLGGKGANPAVALARLGLASALVGCVGADDFGRRALVALQQEGVDVSGLVMLPDADTGVALIMVDDGGQNTILVVNGANDHLTPEHVSHALQPMWGDLRAILVNFEIPEAAVAAAVREGVTHGVPVVVDAGPPRRYAAETWRGAAVLSPNEEEAKALLGYAVDDETSALRAAHDLLATGPQAVVLKLGARGALLCTPQGALHVPPFQVSVVDTTGAGDAFTAGLVAALVEGMALPQAVRFANAAGALAVTQLGTMNAMPTRAQVQALLAAQHN